MYIGYICFNIYIYINILIYIYNIYIYYIFIFKHTNIYDVFNKLFLDDAFKFLAEEIVILIIIKMERKGKIK